MLRVDVWCPVCEYKIERELDIPLRVYDTHIICPVCIDTRHVKVQMVADIVIGERA